MRDRTSIGADQVAGLIADALVDASLVQREHFEDAARIAATEIDVRLAMGNEIVPSRSDPGPRDLELYSRIDEVLHFIWDPIGVAGIPEARDEYDGYLPQVFRLLKENTGEERIASHLLGVATHDMGTVADPSRARMAASALVDWAKTLAEKQLG